MGATTVKLTSGIMHLRLDKLLKLMGDKPIGFCESEGGNELTDTEARRILAGYLSLGYNRVPLREERTPVMGMENEATQRVARMRAKLKELEAEERAYVLKHHTLNVPAALRAKIAACKDEIKSLESYTPKPLSALVKRGDIKALTRQMIKLHVICDYMAGAAMDLRVMLDKMDVHDCNLFIITSAIEKQAAAFANIVCHPEFADLAEFMVTNDQLLKHIDILVERYFDENIKKIEDL